MITIIAAILFTVYHILNKSLYIVTFLENYPQIDLIGIRLQGLLAFETLAVRVDVVAVKKPHDLQTFRPQCFNRINGTGCAACMQ
jgi:hypothetical protein